MSLSPAVAAYDHILLDFDGCVWVGDDVVDGSPEAVAALRAAGKQVAFLTNDARHSGEEYVRKLWRLGFRASLEEVVTVGGALQFLLASRDRPGTAFVVGAPAVHRHVLDAGMRVVNGTDLASRADLVVVAGHDHADFDELRIATQAVLRGAELIGMTRDRNFPMPDGPWPASGALLAAVEYATDRTADVVLGKPEPALFDAARDRLGPGRALMVGDRLDTDVAGAKRAGVASALVLTGATSREEALAAGEGERPDHVAASLARLVLG